jgi:predicted exporter
VVLTPGSLLPVALAIGAVYAVHRFAGMKIWHALVCVLAGLVLASTFLGADLTTFLSQITGGRLP